MSAIGAGLTPLPSTPSYSPLGKPPVGLESQDTKNQTLPPVEESPNTDKARNQFAGKKIKPVSTDDERNQGGRDGTSTQELSDDELNDVRELAAIDREVRAHEAAHLAVGGSLAGAPSFRFITGPDGKQYAVGGEVPISLGQVPDDPEATLRNAGQVHAAALAPAKPSAQDLQVAAAATQLIADAQLQLSAQRVAALTANAGGRHAASAEATGAFKQAAGHNNAPGVLLDQRA
jgi:SprA-related family